MYTLLMQTVNHFLLRNLAFLIEHVTVVDATRTTAPVFEMITGSLSIDTDSLSLKMKIVNLEGS